MKIISLSNAIVLPSENEPTQFLLVLLVVFLITVFTAIIYMRSHRNFKDNYSQKTKWEPKIPQIGEELVIANEKFPMKFIVTEVDEAEKYLGGELVIYLPTGCSNISIQRYFSEDISVERAGFCINYQIGNQTKTATWDFYDEEERLIYDNHWGLDIYEITTES